jgi:hypothetical protein
MILNSLNQVRCIVIKTIFGTEKAIMYLDKIFVADKLYGSLNEAISGCRGEVDLGMAVLIVPEVNRFCVWLAIPEELLLEPAN